MILKSIDDILNRYADSGLALFDKAIRDDWDDDTIRRKLKKLYVIYRTEEDLAVADERMKTAETMEKP